MQLPRGAGILIDHRQRAAKDFRSRAVVLHQPDAAQAGKILTEPFKAACLRAPKAVNRLIRVPDDKEAASLPVPGPDQPVLEGVAVLKLIDQQMPEPPVRRFCRLGLPQRLEQQVVEVEQAALLQAPGVPVQKRRVQLLEGRQAVFPPGNLPQKVGRRNLFIQRAQRLPGKGKSLRFPEQPDLSEQCKADRMEGSDGDPFRGTLSQRGLQPSAQLFRSTVGESDGGNLTRTYPPLLHQPENPFDEGACFSGAGARRHRHRPFLRRHRGALLLVERKGLRRLPRHLPAGRGLLGRLFRGGAALRRRFPELTCPLRASRSPGEISPIFPYSPSKPGLRSTSPVLSRRIPSLTQGPAAAPMSSSGVSRRMVNSGPSDRSIRSYLARAFTPAAATPSEAAMTSSSGTRL